MPTTSVAVVDFGITLCSELYFKELDPEMLERVGQVLLRTYWTISDGMPGPGPSMTDAYWSGPA